MAAIQNLHLTSTQKEITDKTIETEHMKFCMGLNHEDTYTF